MLLYLLNKAQLARLYSQNKAGGDESNGAVEMKLEKAVKDSDITSSDSVMRNKLTTLQAGITDRVIVLRVPVVPHPLH